MNKVLILIVSLSLSYALKVGERVDSSLINKLNIDTNKIVIIDFFASWCHSCEKEIPLISQYNTTIDKNKIEIIGIDVDRDKSDGIEFQKKLKKSNNLNFRVIDDPSNEIIAIFKPLGMPALYILKDAKIVEIIYGAIDDIDQVLNTKIKGL